MDWGRLFGAKREDAPVSPAPPANPARAALLQVVAERGGAEPLLGAQLAGEQVLQRLIEAMGNEQGVHIESLVTALGALGGRACHEAVVAAAAAGALPPGAMVAATGANGDRYLFGDAINALLAEDDPSLWSLVAGAVQQLGAPLPDLGELFRHNAAGVGGEDYGRPRFATGTSAGDTPLNYVRTFEPALSPIVRDLCPEPQRQPLAYGFALQALFRMAGQRFDLTALTRVAMDSAIAMAKLRPDRTGHPEMTEVIGRGKQGRRAEPDSGRFG